MADEENGSFADPLSERKQVHRAGHLTLRPSAPWTPDIHALLRHLETVGFTGSPRIIGTGIDAKACGFVRRRASHSLRIRPSSADGT